MKYKLFIDDERFPPRLKKDHPAYSQDFIPWVIARSSAEAIAIHINYGCPELISFDHDLGGTDTSIKYIDWLVNKSIDLIELGVSPNDIKFPEYEVHSQNPVGAANIVGRMQTFNKFLSEQQRRIKLTIGDHVRFSHRVFFQPYIPYYDAYLGHTFVVEEFHEEDPNHVKVACIDDPSVRVLGYVHDHDLIILKE